MSNFMQVDANRLHQSSQTSKTSIESANQSEIDVFNSAIKGDNLGSTNFKEKVGNSASLDNSLENNLKQLAQRDRLSGNDVTTLNNAMKNTSPNTANSTDKLVKSNSFSNLLENDLKQSAQKDIKSNIDNQNPFANMTNPLDTLFGNANVNAKEALATPQAPTTPSPMNEKLVEMILVSQPDAENQEVRLTLSKDVLADTEIKITRDIHGTLNVTLVTNNASSFQTLVQAQHDLKAILEETETDIKVSVESDDAGQNDSNQRSKGYVDYTNENV